MAIRYNLPCIFVASHVHRKTTPEKGEWIYVENEKEAADLYILNHIKKGDILVTQDIGLASIALAKEVYVISPRGIKYTEETIMISLDFRYLAGKERRKGRYLKGPKAFTSEDLTRFEVEMEQLILQYGV